MSKNLYNDEIINNLRLYIDKKLSTKDFIPNSKVVKKVVDGICDEKSLSEIASKIKSSSKEESEKIVLDIVAIFGTWLTHSEGKLNTQTVSKNSEIINLGFEPTNYHKRDVSKALIRIKSQSPNDETISRFVARTYKERTSVITHSVVAGLWGFITRDRLDRISNVSDDTSFLQSVVGAYDFLRTSLRDAEIFLSKLRNIKISTKTDLSKLAEDIKNNSWILESEFKNIEKYVNLSIENQEFLELLKIEFPKFLSRLDSYNLFGKSFELDEITAGQVKRICSNAGLIVDSSSDQRAIELEIRQTLKKMRLSNDQDLLLPTGLKASEKGRLQDFWIILQSRIDGDTTWSEQLQELIS